MNDEAGKTVSDHESFKLDPRGGQPMGRYSVSLSGGMLRFDYSDLKSFSRRGIEGSDLIIDFANLVRPSLEEPSRKVPVPEWVPPVTLDEFSLPDSMSRERYKVADGETILAVADAIGPLFGIPPEGPFGSAIVEPLDAWIAAAKAMNFAERGEAVLDNLRFGGSPDLIDGYLTFGAVFAGSGWATCCASKSLGTRLPTCYREVLASEDESELAFAPARDEVSRPPVLVTKRWSSDSATICVRVGPMTDLEDPVVGYQLLSGPELREEDRPPSDTEMTAEQSLVEALVQGLVSVHTAHVGAGWSILDAEHPSDIVFDTTYRNGLERLWCEFARCHSRGRIGACERCGRLFSALDQRKDFKRFCSKECQERAKAKRQRERKGQEGA